MGFVWIGGTAAMRNWLNTPSAEHITYCSMLRSITIAWNVIIWSDRLHVEESQVKLRVNVGGVRATQWERKWEKKQTFSGHEEWRGKSSVAWSDTWILRGKRVRHENNYIKFFFCWSFLIRLQSIRLHVTVCADGEVKWTTSDTNWL